MPDPTYEKRPYWHATMPEVPRFDDRPLPERADVVVIGGGYTGLVAALGLARSGARVTVLEKEHLGWGASTRNGGIFHPGLKLDRTELVQKHGQALGRAIHRAGLDSFFTAERFVQDEGFDCDYRRSGLAILAWSTQHAAHQQREADEYAEAGLTARIHDGTEVHQELGSDHYPGCLVLEESGMIHPGRYFAGIAGKVIDAGVDLHTGLGALRVERDGTDRIVHTDRGAIRSEAVLLATNGYTDGAVPWVRQRIVPVGSYIVATEPMGEELAASVSPRSRTFFDSKHFLYYWHVNAERRLIFGGRASFQPTSVDRTAATLTRALATVHPQAAKLRIDYAWGGTIGFTFDRLPHLGEHGGIHYALGYCGSGLALGTTFGLRMAQILGRGADVADEPSAFELTAFPAAPVVPAVYRGRPWFLGLAGEWYRAKGSTGEAAERFDARIVTQEPPPPDPTRTPTPPASPLYKGEPLDAERGPGLGCFWIQITLLAFMLVLTPLTVVWGWDPFISGVLLIITLGLTLFAGQTVIFLLRLVAADRRTRRRPMGESARPTVGQLEDEAARDDGAPGTSGADQDKGL